MQMSILLVMVTIIGKTWLRLILSIKDLTHQLLGSLLQLLNKSGILILKIILLIAISTIIIPICLTISCLKLQNIRLIFVTVCFMHLAEGSQCF